MQLILQQLAAQPWQWLLHRPLALALVRVPLSSFVEVHAASCDDVACVIVYRVLQAAAAAAAAVVAEQQRHQ